MGGIGCEADTVMVHTNLASDNNIVVVVAFGWEP